MSWTKTKIGDFLFERQGKYKPSDKKIQGLKRIEKIDFSGSFHIGDKSSKTNMILIKEGDLVISGINVAKGAMGIYDMKDDVVATIHYSSYTFDKDKINVGYFKRFLKSAEFLRLLNEQIKGGIKTEIKPKHILPLEINLPEIEVQRDIVEKFEKIEEDIENLNTEVLNQTDYLNRLRQVILQEAVLGALTNKWRKFNPQIKSATILFDNIQRERQKDINKPIPILPIDKDEESFIVPENWIWVKLDDLVSPKRGITYGIVKMGSEPKEGGVTALRCSDVRFRHINANMARKVTEEISNQYKRTVLEGGEILLNIRGTLGGCAIVDNSLKGFNIAREIGLIPLMNQSINKYILNVLTSPYFEKEISKNLRGIAYKGLNLNILRNLLIPLPPLEEQKEIVEKIEQLFKVCDELEIQINNSKINSQTLIQAVLKEAFESE